MKKYILIFEFLIFTLAQVYGANISSNISSNIVYEEDCSITSSITIASGVKLTVNGTLTINAGVTLTLNGSISATNIILNGATVNLNSGILCATKDIKMNVVSQQQSGGKGGGGRWTTYVSTLNFNSGKSYVEAKGDFYQNESNDHQKSKINYTDGNATFVVIGTYYDYTEIETNTYHPWKITTDPLELSLNSENIEFAVSSYNYDGKPVDNGNGMRGGNNRRLQQIEDNIAWIEYWLSNPTIPNWEKQYLEQRLTEYKNELSKYNSVTTIKDYLEFIKDYGVNTDDISELKSEISSLLPIELTSFTAEQNGDKVDIAWTTNSEVNNDFFTVEYSIDGITFKTLEIVDGAGTTSEAQEYTISADASLFTGVVYFRLKQTDFNGNYSYSDVIALTVESETEELIVYPNPATDYVTILGTITSAYVCDIYGKKITCFQNGNTFDVAGLSVGTYYVVVKTESCKKVMPFVKE